MMKHIYIIRNLIVSFIAFSILICAFFQNNLLGKIIILLFLTGTISIFEESLFLLFNKVRISNIFKMVFQISLFAYTFTFLIFTNYYSITNKSYSLLIIVAVFTLFTIHFFKKHFLIYLKQERSDIIKTDLRTIPYIGKNTKLDLQKIGITCVEDLKGKNPEELYFQDCKLKGYQEDRCQLYVFRMAVYYADHDTWDEEKLKWWYWKDRDYPYPFKN